MGQATKKSCDLGFLAHPGFRVLLLRKKRNQTSTEHERMHFSERLSTPGMSYECAPHTMYVLCVKGVTIRIYRTQSVQVFVHLIKENSRSLQFTKNMAIITERRTTAAKRKHAYDHPFWSCSSKNTNRRANAAFSASMQWKYISLSAYIALYINRSRLHRAVCTVRACRLPTMRVKSDSP